MTDQKKVSRLYRINRKIQRIIGGWFGTQSIRKNSNLITSLWHGIKQTNQTNYLILRPNKSIDIEATAFRYNIPLEILTLRIQQRKQETSLKAKMLFFLGAFLSVSWIYQVIFYDGWTIGKIFMAGIMLVSSLSMFFLALLHSWINWQIRFLYLGSFNEFLHSGFIIPKSY